MKERLYTSFPDDLGEGFEAEFSAGLDDFYRQNPSSFEEYEDDLYQNLSSFEEDDLYQNPSSFEEYEDDLYQNLSSFEEQEAINRPLLTRPGRETYRRTHKSFSSKHSRKDFKASHSATGSGHENLANFVAILSAGIFGIFHLGGDDLSETGAGDEFSGLTDDVFTDLKSMHKLG